MEDRSFLLRITTPFPGMHHDFMTRAMIPPYHQGPTSVIALPRGDMQWILEPVFSLGVSLSPAQALRPLESWGFFRIVAFEVIFQTLGGFAVSEGRIAENFATQCCECRIVFDQLLAQVHVIVRGVVHAIVIEPRLRAFGEILVMVH